MDPESGEEVTASDVIVELSHVLSDKARKLRSFASRRGITSIYRPTSRTHRKDAMGVGEIVIFCTTTRSNFPPRHDHVSKHTPSESHSSRT